MDVELPDGSVIEGVPEGTTQQQLLRKLYDANHPAYKVLAAQMMKESPWGSGFPKFANELGGKVTDILSAASGHRSFVNPLGLQIPPEVSAGTGFVANVATQAAPALMNSFRFAGDAPVSIAERPARWLMQSAIKPVQADRESGAAAQAIGTMLRENISPTTGGMDKAAKLVRALNDTAERAVSQSPATVSVNSVGQRLQDTATKALTQVNPQEDVQTVKNVWDSFRSSPLIQGATDAGATSPGAAAQAAEDVSIPVQLAHALKKGTYRSLGGKAYGEVGSVSTEAQKALARGLREEVAAAVPEAADALKREATMMNVLDVARNRVILDANKNPMGLAALRIGDNPLSALSFLADRSAYIKGLLARALFQGGQPQLIAPAGIATSEAIANRQNQ